jgi:serine/threonine protein kinase
MRMVPDAYYFGYQTQSLGTRRQLADMAFLLNPDRYISNSGLSVSDRDRLHLLASVAQVLSRLHALGVTVGDLSPKNLLFSLSPPGCFVIDCDAMRVRGESVLAQVETPDWEIPAQEERATPASDAYKFGLLAIRLFARDQSSYDWGPLSLISPEVARLAQESLRTDPSARPSPAEWLPALQAASVTANATASPSAPSVDHPYVPVPPVAPTAPAAPSPAPRPPARKGRRAAAVLGGTSAVVAAIAVVAVVGFHAAASPSASSSQNGTVGTSASGGTSSASQQAAQINDLLDSSAVSRQSLTSAVQDVDGCSNLDSAVAAISAVVNQRSDEYSQASGLSTSALPNGAALRSDLLSALGYSVTADKGFLTWAQEELNGGCSGTAQLTPAYGDGVTASAKAVTAKNSFLELWNPVASSQGLPTRSQQGI